MSVRFKMQNVSRLYVRVNARRAEAVTALDGVDLEIADHRISGIIGDSGAGKSTLARILLGMEAADHGRIWYKGQPYPGCLSRSFRKENQLVLQNPLLAVNPHFSVQQIIGEPLLIEKRPRQEIHRRVLRVLERLGMTERFLRRDPGELSAGELQRVVVARALILEPEFLILDEPFSALDDITATRLIIDLKTIIRQTGIGSLFISHNLRHIRYLADDVAVIRSGKIVERQPNRAFFTAPQQEYSKKLLALLD